MFRASISVLRVSSNGRTVFKVLYRTRLDCGEIYSSACNAADYINHAR